MKKMQVNRNEERTEGNIKRISVIQKREGKEKYKNKLDRETYGNVLVEKVLTLQEEPDFQIPASTYKREADVYIFSQRVA